ncbi:MAG TPA: hypothetical protein PK395_08595 [bacterium]|nr:hypothetical protein [bacterium]HQP97811.1 hypothetical protein [bacterium]
MKISCSKNTSVSIPFLFLCMCVQFALAQQAESPDEADSLWRIFAQSATDHAPSGSVNSVPPSRNRDYLLQWFSDPCDLDGDGAITFRDIFLLSALLETLRTSPTPTVTPTSTPLPTSTPTVTPTPTQDPAQAGLPPVGVIQQITVSTDNTPILLDFPTGKETYLVIVRNMNLDGTSSEAAISDPNQAIPSKAPDRFEMSTADIDEYFSLPDAVTVGRPIQSVGYILQAAPPAVGDQRSFLIYGGATVTGTLRYLGSHAAIYVDNTIWMQGEAAVDQDLLDSQGEFFDSVTYPVISSVFGAPGDVNADGHIAILLTTVAASVGGDAFFYSGDLFTRNELDPRFPTNTMEILYVAPPNTPGRSIDEGDIPGNISHEFQHLINFYYHSLVYGSRNGLHDEEKWLDEGLSHLAEDFVGYARATNPDRIQRFLGSTDTVGIVVDYNPSSTQRGGEYLLCRYLSDRFGEGVIQKIVKTGKQGISNVEAAVGTSFKNILRDWSRTVFLSDLEITSDPKYNYTAFADLGYAPGRWWGKPKMFLTDFSSPYYSQHFGALYYGLLPGGAFGFALFRHSNGGSKEIVLERISGPAPEVDLVRLPNFFEYPGYIDTDFWDDVILDEPLLDIFRLGEPRVISGRSVDGQPLQSVKILWWNSWTSGIGPDQRVYAAIDGDRFTATVQFNNPSTIGTWTFALRVNGASQGYNATITVVESFYMDL